MIDLKYFKISTNALPYISALLLGFSWDIRVKFFLFIAWALLFYYQYFYTKTNKPSYFYLHLYFGFLIWNIIVSWWILNASFGGAMMAIFCNSALMTLVFWIYIKLKLTINSNFSEWLFVPLWLAFEYIHTLWDISWPWLTLGNSFAFNNKIVQWYEFTGVSGGSLWVLLMGIVIYKAYLLKNKTYKLLTVLIFILPQVLSMAILYFRTDALKQPHSKDYNVVIVQPNIDPYNEKFSGNYDIQLQKMLAQVKPHLSEATNLLVLPETYITENIYEQQYDNSFSLQFLKRELLNKYPNLSILTGAGTVCTYKLNETKSSTARLFEGTNMYYDYYNTALFLNSTSLQFYHKSKLVPGVEKMPFPFLFKPFEKLAINLGGTTGSLGYQDERTNFLDKKRDLKICPAICYESIYGDFLTEYIRQGAQAIVVITNDGWWGNTPGYCHHVAYATLRAIETRKELVRCANTGISCFINALGETEQATPYWQQAVIKKNILPNAIQTFYVRYGDVISYTACLISALLILFLGGIFFLKKYNKIKQKL